jgi:hypothetical protein
MATQYSVRMRDGRVIAVYSDATGANIDELIRQALSLGSNRDEVDGVQEVRRDVPLPSGTSTDSFIVSREGTLQTPSGVDISAQLVRQFNNYGSGWTAGMMNERASPTGDVGDEVATALPKDSGPPGDYEVGMGASGFGDFNPALTPDTSVPTEQEPIFGVPATFREALSNLGIRAGAGGSRAERDVGERFQNPLYLTSQIQNALGLVPNAGVGQTPFAETLARAGEGGVGGYMPAIRNAFGALRGWGDSAAEQEGLGSEQLSDIRGLANPTEDKAAAAIIDMALQAGNINRGVSSRFARAGGYTDLLSDFAAQGPSNRQANLAQFVANRFDPSGTRNLFNQS